MHRANSKCLPEYFINPSCLVTKRPCERSKVSRKTNVSLQINNGNGLLPHGKSVITEHETSFYASHIRTHLAHEYTAVILQSNDLVMQMPKSFM